jgi:AcrR family transcriptional regulator
MTSKEIIVDSAMKMFVSRGVKAVRMDDIAHELSVSKRTLYELFGDKEELLYQSIVHYLHQTAEHRNKLVEDADNVMEVMIICLRDMVTSAPVASRLRRNLLRFYPAVHQRIEQDIQSESRRNIAQWIKRSVEQGYFTKTSDSDFVVKVLHDSAQGMMGSDLYETSDHVEVVSMMTYALVIFIRGLCTAKGVEIIDKSFDKYFGGLVASSASKVE